MEQRLSHPSPPKRGSSELFQLLCAQSPAPVLVAGAPPAPPPRTTSLLALEATLQTPGAPRAP
jgi:hypothetical protein